MHQLFDNVSQRNYQNSRSRPIFWLGWCSLLIWPALGWSQWFLPEVPGLSTAPAAAQPSNTATPVAAATPSIASQISLNGVEQQAFTQLIKAIVVEQIPTEIEERENWGKTVEVLRKVKLRHQRGLKFKLEKQKKEVPHGLWQHYRITLPNPDQNLSIAILNLQQLPEKSGVRFTLMLRVQLLGFAHFEHYNNGLELLRMDAETDIELLTHLTCEVAFDKKGVGLLSQWSLEPKVTAASIQLPNIDVRRIGGLKKEWAHEIGDKFRKLSEKKLQSKSAELVELANREIAKLEQKGKLQFSLYHWLFK